MVTVSICIPAYNNVSCVERLCDSIAQQTYNDYEVIITDDSDNKEIQTYLYHNCTIPKDKIRYYHNSKKLGPIYNWNCAIKKAEGQYVKIMFSDDWFAFPDSLEKMISLLEQNPEASFAFCGSRQMDSVHMLRERHASDKFIHSLQKDYRYLFLGNEIGAPSATIYRNGDYQFVEESNWASDMFLYFNILKENANVIVTKEPLVCIMEHDDQYTNTFTECDERKINDYKLMYEKYHLSQFKAARERMIEMIIDYKKGNSYAKECGYSGREYFLAKVEYFIKRQIPGYYHTLIYKLSH